MQLKPVLLYLFLWLSLAGTFLYDWFSPLGITDCTWYFVPLFLAGYVGRCHLSLQLAGLITVLSLLGFYASPPGGVPPQSAAAARLVTVIAIWVIAFLVYRRKLADLAVRRMERALRCINDCHQIITRGSSEGALLKDVCQTIISEGGYRMAWIGFAERDAAKSIRIGAVAGHDESYLDAAKITWSATDPRGCGPAGTAIRTGKKVVCNDFLKDPSTVPWRSEAARRGYAAGIVLPLLSLEKNLGMLMIYGAEPDSFGTEEIQLLERLADNLSFGIVTLRQREQQLQAEAALHQAHQFHLKLLYQAPALIWRAGLDAKCDWFNHTWLAFTGRPLEQELGDGWAEGVFAEDLPACLATYQEAFTARRAFEMEYRLRRHDGQYRWIVDHGIPYEDEAGNFAGYFGYCFDITERRQSQEDLKFHGLVLHRLLEGVYLLRAADHTIFYANPGMEQMFGYARGALPGQPASLLYAPGHQYPEGFLQHISARLAAHGTWAGEVESRRQDGSVFWTYVTVASTVHPQQGAVHILTHLDISARKHAESALLASETRLRTYLQQAGDAFFAHDQAGRLLDVNEMACASMGYTREELLNLAVWDLDPDCHPGEAVQLWQNMDPGQVVALKSRHRRKDGTLFPIELVLRREDFQEQPLYLGLVRDISGRVQQENEIRRMNRLYAAANEINQTIVQVAAREPMFAEVCRVLVKTGGFAMAWVGWLQGGGSSIQVAARHGDRQGYLDDLNVLPAGAPAGTGPTGTALREGRTVVCRDIATDPLMERWRDKALAHGLASLLAVPIRRHGGIAGALVVYASEKNFFGSPEVALLEASARDISIGLAQLDREEQRRQAEAALRQSEARLQGYFNTLSAGVGITSPTAGWIDANPRLQEMLGYSLAELRSLDWIELTHPDDREQHVSLYQEVLSGQRDGYTMDKRFLRKTGEALWTNLAVRCVRQADGQVDCFVAMIFDISQRKSAELALQESELRRKLAMEAADMGLWDWDMTTGRSVWSEAHEALWGYQPGEFNGDHQEFLSRVHPEDRARLHQAGEQALAARTTFACEFRVVWPDASIHWMHSSGRHFFNDRGQAVRMLGVVQDISARKEAQAALHENEERLRLALQVSHQGIYDVVNLTTGETYTSPEYALMLGYDPAGFRETTAGWISRLHPEDSERAQKTFAAFVAGELPEYNLEFRLRTRDGGWLWIQSVARIISRDALGAPRRIVGTHKDITQRKQMELILAQREAQYRQIVETAQEGIWLLDAAGCTTYVNQRLADMFGCAVPEFTGRSFLDFMDESARAEAIQYFEQRKQGLQTQHDFRFRRKDGSQLWAIVSNNPLFDANGRFTGVLGMLTDITDRQQAEERLRASESQMQFVANHAPVKLAHCDRHQRFKFVNQRYADMQGLRVDEIVGRTVADVLGPENYAKAAHGIERVLAGESVQYEMVANTNAGAARNLNVTYEPERADSGEVIGFVAAISDITLLKVTQATGQRLMLAIDQAAESIIFTDNQGTILYVNHGFEQNSGYAWDDVVNRNVRLLKSGSHAPEYYEQVWQTLARGESWRGRFINRRKNGTFYEEKSIISPVRNERGEITSYVAVNHDVTREESLQRQVIEAQKMEVVGQLAGGVAHDFNNILAALSIQVELLAMRPDLPPGMRKSMNSLETGLEKAIQLTRQLLTFSRRQALEVKSLDLDRVLRDQLQMLGRLLGEQLELVIQNPVGETYVNADPGMMDQVIMNLCINARDAMPKGGRLTVGVRVVEIHDASSQIAAGARPGNFVCLSVADTGCGMDEDTQRRIFEPFFTTKGVGQGTGLGLATVYGIVQQHAGWIEVESQVGKGTEFRVYLPSSAAAPEAEVPAEAPPMLPGHANILVVEDEPPVLEAVVTCLKFVGYHVLSATSGAEALSLYGEIANHIDLMLTDMVMPGGLDGWELTEAFRQLNPRLAVIVTSGYNTRLPGKDELARRRIVFLPKPANATRLAATVRQTLAAARAQTISGPVL
ncbi:MAG: PAS domain S-box protein [Verrucomicrobiota bacterium]